MAPLDGPAQDGPGRRPTSQDCGKISQVLARVGDKWTVLIVMLLIGGPQRFNAIKRQVAGISQRMLALTLKGLERDGMVSRTQYPTIPPQVEYALTPMGRSLAEPVMALGGWARAHIADIDAARARYDETAGRRAEPGTSRDPLAPVPSAPPTL